LILVDLLALYAHLAGQFFIVIGANIFIFYKNTNFFDSKCAILHKNSYLCTIKIAIFAIKK